MNGLSGRARRFAPAALFATLVLAALACGKKFEDHPVYRPVGSTKVGFQDPAIAMLGKAEGPYVFIKSLSPTVVQLVDSQNKTEDFRLIGLSDDLYADPAPRPVPGKPTPTPTPTPKPAEAERQKAIREVKMAAIKTLCGSKSLYVIRLSHEAPAMVYLLTPDGSISTGKPATGEATLLNAQLLRQGQANLELNRTGAMDHPLFNLMLDCQLASVAEAEKRPSGGNELWTQYKIKMPAGMFDERLAEVKKGI